MANDSSLHAGAAQVDITPTGSVFLAGYPHVRRMSTGVLHPLLSCALYLRHGDRGQAIFIANDIIYLSKVSVARCRQEIADQTGVAESDILISVTHTHSGPKMLDPIATEADEAVPKTDPAVVREIEDRIIECASRAVANVRPAEAGLAVADATGVGTNRRDPNGTRDLDVPVLVVCDGDTRKPFAVMWICCMHPTVLHEDSTLVCGDFPGMARAQLRDRSLGSDCVILHHTGPAGNQSPRHVTRANTTEEAGRLGGILAGAVSRAIEAITYRCDLPVRCRSGSVNLPLRSFPSEAQAQAKVKAAAEQLRRLRESDAPRTQVRTAEVDWFGAEETLTLARVAADGRLQKAADAAMPAEVQVISIGDWNFVAWPGEMFVEFGLAVKAQRRNTFVISYANGELQGYLVTREAAEEGGYESQNAIFKSPQSGDLLVAKTLKMLE